MTHSHVGCSAVRGVAVTHLRDSSGTNSVHNQLFAGPRCENQVAPCEETPMLRSSSMLSSSKLVQSSSFPLSLFFVALVCSLPSFPSSVVPCVCPSSAGPDFCAAFVENTREKPWAPVNWCSASTSVEAPAGELALDLGSGQQSFHSSL